MPHWHGTQESASRQPEGGAVAGTCLAVQPIQKRSLADLQQRPVRCAQAGSNSRAGGVSLQALPHLIGPRCSAALFSPAPLPLARPLWPICHDFPARQVDAVWSRRSRPCLRPSSACRRPWGRCCSGCGSGAAPRLVCTASCLLACGLRGPSSGCAVGAAHASLLTPASLPLAVAAAIFPIGPPAWVSRLLALAGAACLWAGRQVGDAGASCGCLHAMLGLQVVRAECSTDGNSSRRHLQWTQALQRILLLRGAGRGGGRRRHDWVARSAAVLFVASAAGRLFF